MCHERSCYTGQSWLQHQDELHGWTTTFGSVWELCVAALCGVYSSAINNILPHSLVDKLVNLGLPHVTCMWIESFLSGCSQRVKVSPHTSTALNLCTSSPQGCVLSRLLYTHDFTPIHHRNNTVKFADDTTVVGLISRGDETAYLDEVERLTV